MWLYMGSLYVVRCYVVGHHVSVLVAHMWLVNVDSQCVAVWLVTMQLCQ